MNDTQGQVVAISVVVQGYTNTSSNIFFMVHIMNCVPEQTSNVIYGSFVNEDKRVETEVITEITTDGTSHRNYRL